MLGLAGVWVMECNESLGWNWRGPTWPRGNPGEGHHYKRICVKSDEVRRESEGVVVPEDKDSKTLLSR